MRQLAVAITLIIFCSSTISKGRKVIDLGQTSFHYDSIPTSDSKARNGDLLLRLVKEDSVLEEHLTKDTRFRLIKKGRCGKNSWYLLCKETPQCDSCAMPFYKKPYKGLFLSLRDSNDKSIGTLKLAEHFELQFMTPWESRLTSRLTNDTTLISREVSTACSDVDLSCWGTVVRTQWTMTCDKIKLEKSEKIKEVSK